MTTSLRLYGDAALPLVEGLMPHVSRLLDKGRFPGAAGAASRAPACTPSRACVAVSALHGPRDAQSSPCPCPCPPSPAKQQRNTQHRPRPAAEERRVAICIMDDVLEHSPAGE